MESKTVTPLYVNEVSRHDYIELVVPPKCTFFRPECILVCIFPSRYFSVCIYRVQVHICTVHDISSPTSSHAVHQYASRPLRITIYNCTNCVLGVSGSAVAGRRELERQGSGVRGVRGIITGYRRLP